MNIIIGSGQDESKWNQHSSIYIIYAFFAVDCCTS